MEKRIYQLLKLSGKVNSTQEAQAIVDAERVKVDGVIIRSLKYKVNTKFQQVTLDNEPLIVMQQMIYILLNKPKWYTCQKGEKDPYVMELIKTDMNLAKTLSPVGRIDVETQGALLITNDGKLAHRLLSPEAKVYKTYEAVVEGLVTPEQIEKLKKGVVINIDIDNRITKYRTKPAEAKILEKGEKRTLIELKIMEGKKRQVRKMCDAIGHKVIGLVRTKIGNLGVGDLEPGDSRYVTRDELREKLGF